MPRIYITSERPLEPQFEKYRIKINPLDMHHVMAFASLYIGDSQTMAAEAGVLGVPFVRFNDFVGRIGYLRELEDKYQLGFGVHASPIRNDASSKPNEPIIMSREQGSLNEPLRSMSRADALNDGTVDVVLIGHSKTFVPYNEKTLEPFLRWVSKLD